MILFEAVLAVLECLLGVSVLILVAVVARVWYEEYKGSIDD